MLADRLAEIPLDVNQDSKQRITTWPDDRRKTMA
jgi:hypothetical protein